MEKKELTLKQKARRSEVQCKYIKANYRSYGFKLHKTYEPEMIDFLEKKENLQQYIKELIKRDMEKDN